MKCKYRNISRVDDFNLTYSEYDYIEENEYLYHDLVEIFCLDRQKNGTNKMLYYQVIPKKVRKKEARVLTGTPCKPLNILSICFDSVSSVSWILRLNKSNDYLLNKMGFQVMNGFNIIGDGTPASLISVLTSKSEEELPSALKNDPNGRYIDEVFPFIFKDLHENGNANCLIEIVLQTNKKLYL